MTVKFDFPVFCVQINSYSTLFHGSQPIFPSNHSFKKPTMFFSIYALIIPASSRIILEFKGKRKRNVCGAALQKSSSLTILYPSSSHVPRPQPGTPHRIYEVSLLLPSRQECKKRFCLTKTMLRLLKTLLREVLCSQRSHVNWMWLQNISDSQQGFGSRGEHAVTDCISNTVWRAVSVHAAKKCQTA